jgi:hypothetical protein
MHGLRRPSLGRTIGERYLADTLIPYPPESYDNVFSEHSVSSSLPQLSYQR